jgi:hypothetical protein
MPFFHTFDKPKLDDQMIFLTRYIYSPSEPPKLKNSIYKIITQINPSFKNTNFVTKKRNDFPDSLDSLLEIYMNQEISPKDKELYLSTFVVPFMSTGQSLKNLEKLNPEVMEETLNKLMTSKKIQYINNILYGLCSDLRIEQICKPGSPLKTAIEEQKAKYNAMYNTIEEEIKVSWINAVEKEPRFAANEELFKLSSLGNKGPKKLGGRKKYTLHKKYRLRRTRRKN